MVVCLKSFLGTSVFRGKFFAFVWVDGLSETLFFGGNKMFKKKSQKDPKKYPKKSQNDRTYDEKATT